MTKTFHHHFLFHDPSGNEPSPHKFCDELMRPYGSTRLPVLFHGSIFPDDGSGGWDGSGDIDERKFRHVLAKGDNNGKIPQDSLCWLNIEHANHNVYKHIQESPWTVPQQEGIDFFHAVLDVAQDERPDVKFGLYGQVPFCTGYHFLLSDTPEVVEGKEHLFAVCRPLAERLGFLLPNFYDQKVRPIFDTPEDRLRWIRTVLEAARYYYPGKLLIGMPWMEYIDLWRQRPDPDTVEAQVARRLSGWTWLRINQTILELADGVLWWGGDQTGNSGKTFWDPTAEWWDASKLLFKRGANHGQ